MKSESWFSIAMASQPFDVRSLRCKNINSDLKYGIQYESMFGVSRYLFLFLFLFLMVCIFIGPKFDNCPHLSVTHQLTNTKLE